MTSIDLYDDFNEEEDQLMGDREEEDQLMGDGEEEDNQNDEEGPENVTATKEDVDHGIKVVKVKRKLVTLNAERLKGPRGIIAIDDFFNNVKLKGRGHEKDDLKDIMKRLEHWAHRMFPKYHFDDSLAKIERLGRKKEIAIHMTRYRMGQLTKDDDEDQRVLSDEDNEKERDNSLAQEMPFDEFDQLLDQQIALSTSALPSTTFGNISSISGFSQIPQSSQINQSTSSSSQPQTQQQSQKPQLTDEQKARIEENRKRAMALREARLKQQQEKEMSLKRQQDEAKKSTSNVFSDLLFDDD